MILLWQLCAPDGPVTPYRHQANHGEAAHELVPKAGVPTPLSKTQEKTGSSKAFRLKLPADRRPWFR